MGSANRCLRRNALIILKPNAPMSLNNNVPRPLLKNVLMYQNKLAILFLNNNAKVCQELPAKMFPNKPAKALLVKSATAFLKNNALMFPAKFAKTSVLMSGGVKNVREVMMITMAIKQLFVQIPRVPIESFSAIFNTQYLVVAVAKTFETNVVWMKGLLFCLLIISK